MKRPRPNPQAQHPTSIAIVEFSPGCGWHYRDQRNCQCSHSYREREQAVRAALDGGFRTVRTPRGYQLAKVVS